MTSASELFSTRRSRLGRSDPDFGTYQSLNRTHHHHHHNHHHSHRRHGNHHHRSDSDVSDHLRRIPRLHQSFHRVGLPGTGLNSIDAETYSNSSSSSLGNLNGSERLPGSVLLARARLLERLRGVSLSTNSLGNRYDEPEGLQLYTENKKPEGLTQGAINCLHQQIFNSTDVNNETTECSICLESFTKGDVLIRLPCTHSFHSSCLNPWLTACGDCPYCRRAIVSKDIESCK